MYSLHWVAGWKVWQYNAIKVHIICNVCLTNVLRFATDNYKTLSAYLSPFEMEASVRPPLEVVGWSSSPTKLSARRVCDMISATVMFLSGLREVEDDGPATAAEATSLAAFSVAASRSFSRWLVSRRFCNLDATIGTYSSSRVASADMLAHGTRYLLRYCPVSFNRVASRRVVALRSARFAGSRKIVVNSPPRSLLQNCHSSDDRTRRRRKCRRDTLDWETSASARVALSCECFKSSNQFYN